MRRSLDVCLAVLALTLASPLLAAAALTILATMGPPILFRQRRAGQHGRSFLLYKFRTMTDSRGPDGRPLPDEARLARLGRFLRRTSLDELPQLWNVLKGDMSLVGPRALLFEYVSRYNQHQLRRLEVKPGITGWVQINGRNQLTWDEKFELDIWYVDHRCLRLDAKILATTVLTVLRTEGISQAGHATMAEFLGTQKGPEVGSTQS